MGYSYTWMLAGLLMLLLPVSSMVISYIDKRVWPEWQGVAENAIVIGAGARVTNPASKKALRTLSVPLNDQFSSEEGSNIRRSRQRRGGHWTSALSRAGHTHTHR